MQPSQLWRRPHKSAWTGALRVGLMAASQRCAATALMSVYPGKAFQQQGNLGADAGAAISYSVFWPQRCE